MLSRFRSYLRALALAAAATLAVSCGGGGGGGGHLPYAVLDSTPDPATVFHTIERTFRYANNLTNGIWHRQSNTISVGDYASPGHWHHGADTGGHPKSPDIDTGVGGFQRLVHMPAVNMVVFTDAGESNGMASAFPADLRVATIDSATGLLGAPSERRSVRWLPRAVQRALLEPERAAHPRRGLDDPSIQGVGGERQPDFPGDHRAFPGLASGGDVRQ